MRTSQGWVPRKNGRSNLESKSCDMNRSLNKFTWSSGRSGHGHIVAFLDFFSCHWFLLRAALYFFFQISLPWCSLDHYIILLEKLKRRNYGLRITFFDVIVVKRPKFERSKVANCCYPQVHHSYLNYEDVFLFIRLMWVIV